jgi:hypothetical protein
MVKKSRGGEPMNPVYFRPDRQLIEAVKPLVKEVWLLWQQDESLFKSPLHFALEVLAKPFNQGEEKPVIKEHKTIIGWAKDWEKEVRS